MSEIERLKMVMSDYKKTPNSFSKFIGLKTPQVLYDILKGRNGISKDLAEKISAKCVNYGLGWLMTGEGEEPKKNAVYPILNVDQEANVKDKDDTCKKCAERDATIQSLNSYIRYLEKTIIDLGGEASLRRPLPPPVLDSA